MFLFYVNSGEVIVKRRRKKGIFKNGSCMQSSLCVVQSLIRSWRSKDMENVFGRSVLWNSKVKINFLVEV